MSLKHTETVVQPKDGDATREQLLMAAGEVFSELGYRASTVRMICDRAQANIASVNYHFGDKETLYRQLILRLQIDNEQRFPADIGIKPGASSEERLRAFIRSMFLRMFTPGPNTWRCKILVREMIDPTPGLAVIVYETFRPMGAYLVSIVAELTGRPPTDPMVELCVRSILGQVILYFHSQHDMRITKPGFEFTAAELEKLTEHVTLFSLAALTHYARARKH